MIHWGPLSLSDGFSVFMEGAVQFNDYVLSLNLFIFWFVVLLVAMEFGKGMQGGDRDVSSVFILEFVWTLLPMILLVFMAYPSMILLYLGDVSSEADVMIQVVGHQWFWEYCLCGNQGMSYMDSVNQNFRLLDVDNRLVVPAFESLGFLLTSSDVIHSWTIPALGVKMDCVPGRLNLLSLEVLGCGVFYGQCSEMCGILHSFMPIVLESISVSDFLKG